MNAAIQQHMQAEFDINLDGDEFPALVTYNDIFGELEVTRCEFDILDKYHAALEPEHFGLIEQQLTEYLTKDGNRAKVEKQIEAAEHKQNLSYFLIPQAD